MDCVVYSLCFFVPVSLCQPLHIFSSDQPMLYYLFCTHPPSATCHMSVLVCPRFAGLLRNVTRVGSSHTPSFNSSHSRLAAPFFQLTNIACFKRILTLLWADHPHVHRHLHHKHQGVPLRPHGAQITSHITAPTGALTAPRKSASSTPSSAETPNHPPP